ncbi:MAG: methyltransferase domain-containing protein [Acidocella sp.]|nr:methyltransferase domain-containing protein [Acidocella sp.]
MADFTEDRLLNGRVAYRQRGSGHRSGFEPVLLAASITARSGEMVLDAGTGAGAALLCLAARRPGIIGVGVEIDRQTAEIARQNFKDNGLANIFCVQADIAALPFRAGLFDHVMANPPWFSPLSSPSPDPQRALAHRATPGLLAAWVAAMIRVLRPRGSITLILPAASLSLACAALHTQCGGITLRPLWPRAGLPSKMLLVSARKAVKSPDVILPGLVLHDEWGITPAAQAILSDGAGFTNASSR